MRLIDADALDKTLAEEAVFKIKQADRDSARAEARGLIKAREFVKQTPTVGAVQIVRCRECKHLETLYAADTAIGHCDLGERETFGCKPDDFCSYGERKDGDIDA